MEEAALKLLENANDDDFVRLLTDFNTRFERQFTLPEMPSDSWARLWSVIFHRLVNPAASGMLLTCLNTVRILSRNKAGVDSVVDRDRVSTLVKLAGLVTEEEALTRLNEQINYDVVLEAQKSLFNLVYNSKAIQRYCCGNSCVPGLMCRMKLFRDPDVPHLVKYFDMRILFLLTALCPDIRPQLRTEHHGLTYFIEVLDLEIKTVQEFQESSGLSNNQQNMNLVFSVEQSDLMNEVLKLLYNLVFNLGKNGPDEEEESHCLRLVTILRILIMSSVKEEEKTKELHSHTINLLLLMPPQTYEELLMPMPSASDVGGAMAGAVGGEDPDLAQSYEYDGKDMTVVAKILNYLNEQLRALSSPKPGRLAKETLNPILTLMCEMCQANRSIRKFLRQKILPPLRDVTNKPEDGETTRNKLCSLMTSLLIEIKHLSANFLFILCKENVDRFIKYTGYGNAAGYLAGRGLMLGGRGKSVDYSSDSEESDTEEYNQIKDMINPVTGQFEPPRPSPMEGMSEEQKEHEAMKLVSALKKLTDQKVIKPCRIDADGKVRAVDHILELREGLNCPPSNRANHNDSDSD
ncbi:chaperone Ric-8A-like isoform X2 [Oratosquilla oratoria]|uniref:chaperone Ric-8A-like isoform X2 n=1 Tax=Oratosquilla oratoria TaxID=337810 RepID=UPI003F75BAF1